jgi:transcriptional regulator with XRE-family HTH domain
LDISRYYISRVENGHTIPTRETLERFARVLEVPVFHLVYEEEGPYRPPVLRKSRRSTSGSLSNRDVRLLQRFILLLNQ